MIYVNALASKEGSRRRLQQALWFDRSTEVGRKLNHKTICNVPIHATASTVKLVALPASVKWRAGYFSSATSGCALRIFRILGSRMGVNAGNQSCNCL